MARGRVDASGRTVGGVGGASDVDRVEGVEGVVDANEGVEPFEDFVDRMVATPAVPPAFDHSLVVSVDGEVFASWVSVAEVTDKTIKADSFSPADVALILQRPPPRDEPPCPPPSLDNDPNPDARARVRERAEIE